MFADELGNLGLGAAAQLGQTWGAGCQPWLWEVREGFAQGLREGVGQAQPAPWAHWAMVRAQPLNLTGLEEGSGAGGFRTDLGGPRARQAA